MPAPTDYHMLTLLPAVTCSHCWTVRMLPADICRDTCLQGRAMWSIKREHDSDKCEHDRDRGLASDVASDVT